MSKSFFLSMLIASYFLQGCSTNTSISRERRIPAGGGMTGSGGQSLTVEKNPWFLGGEVVRYCIKKSSDFSLPLDQARKEINYAFSDWKQTLQAFSPKPLSKLWGPYQARLLLIKTFFQMVTINLQSKCTTERPPILLIYLT